MARGDGAGAATDGGDKCKISREDLLCTHTHTRAERQAAKIGSFSPGEPTNDI